MKEQRIMKNNVINISSRSSTNENNYLINRLMKRIEKLEKRIVELSDKNRKISLPCKEGFLVLEVSDVIYLEASSNYTIVYTRCNKKLLVSKTLKYIEGLINSSNFLRIHRSYLINKDFIHKLNRQSGTHVELFDQVLLPVSRSRKEFVLDWFSSSYSNK